MNVTRKQQKSRNMQQDAQISLMSCQPDPRPEMTQLRHHQASLYPKEAKRLKQNVSLTVSRWTSFAPWQVPGCSWYFEQKIPGTSWLQNIFQGFGPLQIHNKFHYVQLELTPKTSFLSMGQRLLPRRTKLTIIMFRLQRPGSDRQTRLAQMLQLTKYIGRRIECKSQ